MKHMKSIAGRSYRSIVLARWSQCAPHSLGPPHCCGVHRCARQTGRHTDHGTCDICSNVSNACDEFEVMAFCHYTRTGRCWPMINGFIDDALSRQWASHCFSSSLQSRTRTRAPASYSGHDRSIHRYVFPWIDSRLDSFISAPLGG